MSVIWFQFDSHTAYWFVSGTDAGCYDGVLIGVYGVPHHSSISAKSIFLALVQMQIRRRLCVEVSLAFILNMISELNKIILAQIL
jgi:hypothetical protein